MKSSHDSFFLKIHTRKFLPFYDGAFVAILKFYDYLFQEWKHTQKNTLLEALTILI